MATRIAQKSCTALFPLWTLSKNDISRKNYIYKEETKLIERNFKYLNVEKKYTYPDYALTLKFSL